VRRHALVLAVVVYVGLDLSLAGMPGAFVFDPADSVESAHGIRALSARPLLAAEVSPAENSIALSTPTAIVLIFAAAARIAPVRRNVSSLPRAVLAPPLSEDVH
jgi:hypothetical protein